MATTQSGHVEPDVWGEFLREWPIARLHTMELTDYSAAGQDKTFTAWLESRLDKMGSIWGGSSFKFGIYSRKDKKPKVDSGGLSYSADYAWYTKYGSTAVQAFEKVKDLVIQVAEAARRGDYVAINAIDLGEAYKWKIAFHYQDRANPGVIAVFKPERLKPWLKGRIGAIPETVSELHRAVLALGGGKDLMELSQEVWEQTAESEPAETFAPPLVSDESETESVSPERRPLNLILYGPPGTGKTYATAKLAVEICDGVVPESRPAMMARYRDLRRLQRIRFVTFHPSFSYEEFVEGIRPATENGQVRYDVRAGVFKQAVANARGLFEAGRGPAKGLDLVGRKLFKMSLGDTSKSEDDWVYLDCIENNYVCIGFAPETDFSGCETLDAVRERFVAGGEDRKRTDFATTAVHYLKNEIQQGDLIVISEGTRRFRAIAEVTGPYVFQAREEGFEHRRPVRWLWKSSESIPVEVVSSKRFSQVTIYLIDQEALNWKALQELVAPKREGGRAPNCVLVIDEINRANLAKTFGELITLLEPSKRLGEEDEQVTELPYSGESFGVPPNLYVVGTMNTADRSIALLDTALRRRFDFEEMPPRADLLEKDVGGIDLQALLAAMNNRIEGLFDRDHVLGHSYLMHVGTFDELVDRFRNRIIPLLQEYFFEDWRRIQKVFNDVDQPRDRQIIQAIGVNEDGLRTFEGRSRFQVNPDISPAAIQKIYA